VGDGVLAADDAVEGDPIEERAGLAVDRITIAAAWE